MDIKYNVIKLKDNKKEEIKDHVSVEEPLEMNLRFKKNGNWQTENLSITMRTPGNDEDLISGFLFNERIIENFGELIKVEKKGDKVGDYNIQNKIEATIDSIKNVDINKLKRNFLTNSSCGICGKTSLESVEVIKSEKLSLSFPKINKETIMKSPDLLMSKQSEFSKTGGIHASSLINDSGKVIATREDVGRHNALDKLIGYAQKNKLIDNNSQFIACSGRLNFELVQKGLMANIGVMEGGPHRIDECYSKGLALSEGWASFFSAWLSVDLKDPDAKFEYMVPRRAPLQFENIPSDVCPGEKNEWRVTGFLWDLVDIHEDFEDTLKIPFKTFWNFTLKKGFRSSSSLYKSMIKKGFPPELLKLIWEQNFLGAPKNVSI